MASQTNTMPTPTSIHPSDLLPNTYSATWDDIGIQIGAALLDGAGPAYLRELRIFGDRDGEARGTISMSTATTATGERGHQGPDLSNDWETYSGAVVLTIGTHTATLPGPRSPTGVETPSGQNEPYSWTVEEATFDASGFSAALDAYYADSTLAITLTLHDGNTPGAPLFDPDTGTAQSWDVDQAITDLTVPEATGNPAPTYAVVGSLPDGLMFDATTRVISGTPTASGSGTITIRATNSLGTDDWTVSFAIFPAPTLEVSISGPSAVNEDEDATLTATVGGTATGTITYAWSLTTGPGSITGSGASVTYEAPMDVASDTAVTVQVAVTRGGLMETATLDFTVSDSPVPTLTVEITGQDRVREGGFINLTTVIGGTATGTITYAWVLVSGDGTIVAVDESAAYHAPEDVLVDTEVVVRITVTRESQTATDDHTILVTTPLAPAFPSDSAPVQNWVTGTAIATITVPEATGTPVPTYSAFEISVPDGLQFDPETRQLTGTPTQTGIGTITIWATNEGGRASYTIPYSITTATVSDDLNVSISGETSVGPAGEVLLTAVTGGSLRGQETYQWQILAGGDGTLGGSTGTIETYTAPMTVASETTVTVRVTVAVGTTTATDDFTITLTTAAVDTLSVRITGSPRVVAGDQVALTAAVGGTATGAITYAWSVPDGLGSIIGMGDAVLFQSIASGAEDTVSIVRCAVTRGGVMASADYQIEVVGVTDPVPSSDPRTGKLPYVGRLRLMGPVTLGDGVALGQSRRITEATVGLFRSAGGVIRQAGMRETGESTPLAVPGINDRLGPEGYPVVTGEVRVPLHDLSTDPTATIEIEQNDPRDLEVTYIAVSFDSED